MFCKGNEIGILLNVHVVYGFMHLFSCKKNLQYTHQNSNRLDEHCDGIKGGAVLIVGSEGLRGTG